jgi:hypothetical protein
MKIEIPSYNYRFRFRSYITIEDLDHVIDSGLDHVAVSTADMVGP